MSKPTKTTKRATRLRRVLRSVAIALAAGAGLSILVVALLRWVDPPTSAFMIRHRVAAWFAEGHPPELHHEWVHRDGIPDSVRLAVIAAEDQRFPAHWGFDTIEIRRAWQDHQAGSRLRGASTISQQTAKNLFLWPGRDPIRKGLEVWLTLWIEILWPKQRILDVYLNIAQLGPDTFGVGAASWRYFDRPAIALRPADAALMAAVLPNPEIYRLDAPSASLRRRAARIQRQMARLGGVAYLRRL